MKKLKSNSKINLKKPTTAIIIKEDKYKEGQTRLNNPDHYKPINQPMVIETA